jgi:hypothetical protein
VCNKKHTKELHDLLMKGSTIVHCEDNEDDEGGVKMITDEDNVLKGDGRQTTPVWTWKRKTVIRSSPSM